MREKKPKYEILESILHKEGPYEPCKKAEPQPSGWLHYELQDGTIGLARPGSWRVKEVRK